jgi:transposase
MSRPTAARVSESSRFPPWRTVYHYFRKWDRDQTLNQMHNGLREQVRLTEGREAASVQDRDGGRALVWALATCFRRVRMVWVDGAHGGGPVTYGAALGLVVQVVTKLAGQIGWINRCRRTVRDYQRRSEHHAAMVQWSMVIIMTRRLARHHVPSRASSALTTAT